MAKGKFHHRVNADKTIDSICLRCFLTAATAANEADLRELEAAHQCDNKEPFPGKLPVFETPNGPGSFGFLRSHQLADGVSPWRDMAWTLLHLDRRLKVVYHNLVAGMNSRSNFGAPKILCVEPDVAVLESRCAVLKYSGYDAASASPHLAEIMLRSRKFDLIVISRLSDFDLHRVVNLADGADLLVLEALTAPSELLFLVAQRLDRQRKA